jgi:TfoX/Sxy family transcriptional regulator of competence genes
MGYDHDLAQRIRRRLGDRPDSSEKEMFGGLAFLINGRMSVGVAGNELMARVGKDAHEQFVDRPGARMMDFTTRPMRGWITVAPDALASDADLDVWIDQGVASALAAGSERPAR